MPRVPCSLYPTSHKTPEILLPAQNIPWGWKEDTVIALSSNFLVGSIFWVPALYVYLYRKWKAAAPKSRQRAVYGAALISLSVFLVAGPQRTQWAKNRLQFRTWRIWKTWCQFVAFEVWRDRKNPREDDNFDHLKAQSITAFAPHGIFPFAIGVGGVPAIAQHAFGKFRIMIATATNLFPIVRDIIHLVNAV
jgi:hypothetical protein